MLCLPTYYGHAPMDMAPQLWAVTNKWRDILSTHVTKELAQVAAGKNETIRRLK